MLNEQLVIKKFQTPQYAFVYWQFWYTSYTLAGRKINNHIHTIAISR